MKICLLGARLDADNMGVSALAAGTVRCILEQFPDASIFFLDYAKSSCTFTLQHGDTQVSIPLVNMRFSKKFYLNNNIAMLLLLAFVLKLIPSRTARRRLVASNACLREIDECDAIGSIAGGDSFSDLYGMGRLLYVSLPQVLAVLREKKLILLPQTIGPFRGRVSRSIGRYILRHAELIFCREHLGVQDAESLMGLGCDSSKIRFCHDVGFVVQPVPPQDESAIGLPAGPRMGSPLVGLNISGLLAGSGASHRNRFGLKVDYEDLIYAIIDFLIVEKGAAVLLVPHVFGNERESDLAVCEKAIEVLQPRYGDAIGLARECYSVGELKYVIGTCDFFIGSRMHACIAAVSRCVPAVPIAYSDKFLGVMQSVGIDTNVVDLRTMDEREILHAIDRAFEHRAQVRQQLAQTMPQVKESVLSLFKGMGHGFVLAAEAAAVDEVPVG